MACPTFSQIVTQMINFIKGKRPSANTNVGTVLNYVVISTVANQLSAQDGTSQSVYSSIQYTQNLQAFVDNAATILPADLDKIGDNYGMTRNSGTQATGTITFRIRTYTTSSPIINIPSGTTISTLATSQAPAVSFATTAGITFTPSFAPSYFNPVSGFYEQSTTIIAQTIGTVGDTGAASITSLVSSVAGIDAVTNTTAATGGTNIESNVLYAARIQIKLEGNNVGTPNGMISLVETNPNVIQALIVGPNDPEMQRDPYGGSVDVYIRGQILTTVSYTTMYTAIGSQSFLFNHQPAISVGTVIGIVGGVPYTFVGPPTGVGAGTDYSVIINPNTLYAGSTKAVSYITFNNPTFFAITSIVPSNTINVITTSGMLQGNTILQGAFSTTITAPVISPTQITVGSTSGFGTGSATLAGFKPDNNTNITITYTYDSLIEILQALFNDNNNHIVASDILVREAIIALISVTASILVLPGFVPPTVVSNVQTALTIYLNALGLGAVIDLSDLVLVIEGVPGVDQVDLSTLSFSSTKGIVTTTVPPGQRISVGKNAYPQANPPL